MIHKSTTLSNKGYFLDLEVYEKYYKKAQTPTTPSLPHMFALRKVLDKINDEGLDNRWQRHKDMALFSQKWALNHGQELFPEKGCESFTLTCIKNVKKWDINNIYERLLLKGFRMDRGYGSLKGKVFRIPHMGNVYMDDLEEYLSIMDEIICQ